MVWLYVVGGVAAVVVSVMLWIGLTNNEFQHRYVKTPPTRKSTVPYKEPPAEGQYTIRDFTTGQTDTEVSAQCIGRDIPLRIMTWNIERGFQFEAILQHLLDIRPDILLLQEVDVGTVRVGGIDVGAELASRLQMHLMFVTHQAVNGGVHGDAILSRYPFQECWITVMPQVRTQLLHTGRKTYAVPGARIQLPSGDALDLYSVHTDAYTGIRGRVKQINAVLQDYHSRNGGSRAAVIAGDLNTMGDGYKRLIPLFCNDDLRWGSLGLTEQQWWRDNVWCHTTFKDASTEPTLKLLNGWLMADKLDWLCVSGLEYWQDQRKHTTHRMRPDEARRDIRVEGMDASDHAFVMSDFVFV